MKKWLGPLYLSLAAAIWGGTYVVSKEVLAYVKPWLLLELRFLLGLLVLGWIARRHGAWSIQRRDVPAMALLAFVGYTCSIGMQFIGTDLSGAAMGSLITAASPALISLFAVWLLRERLHLYKGLAMLTATAGVLIVVGLPNGENQTFLGNTILFGAALTWALYTVLSRKQTLKYSSLTVTAWASLFGVLFTAPAAAAEGLALPADPWLWAGIVYLGVVSTAGAFYFWNKGFEYIDAATGSLFFFMQPLVGSFLGWLLLGEALHWNFFLGALFIAAGMLFSIKEPAAPLKPQEREQFERHG
ncbi:DMT family transporter [Ectobacillus ponti]|uniref:EamA family transporter n=1 Tax=Ectobacillus ponti TaxID=2961894 RepID=A0AA41X1H0_9BACI|nr:EamA family transporter [Ectobacillus ponti]MCP8967012.1 EamA family transporter [Ectobacillus ponti]